VSLLAPFLLSLAIISTATCGEYCSGAKPIYWQQVCKAFVNTIPLKLDTTLERVQLTFS